MDAALGFKLHTGWAAAVAVVSQDGRPQIVDRRRAELIDGSVPAQAYHAAKDLPIAEAKRLVARVEQAAARTSERSLRRLCNDLRAAGHEPLAVAVVANAVQVPDSVERVLASHSLMHAGEGALFRDAVIDAAGGCGLTVSHVRPKQLDLDDEAIRHDLARLGKELGPPWRADQKEATVAAWMALSTAGPARRGGRAGRARAPGSRGRPRSP